MALHSAVYCFSSYFCWDALTPITACLILSLRSGSGNNWSCLQSLHLWISKCSCYTLLQEAALPSPFRPSNSLVRSRALVSRLFMFLLLLCLALPLPSSEKPLAVFTRQALVVEITPPSSSMPFFLCFIEVNLSCLLGLDLVCERDTGFAIAGKWIFPQLPAIPPLSALSITLINCAFLLLHCNHVFTSIFFKCLKILQRQRLFFSHLHLYFLWL